MAEGYGPGKSNATGRRIPTGISDTVQRRGVQVCCDCEVARPVGETRRKGNHCPECGGDLIPSRVYDCPRCGRVVHEADWGDHREECEA